MESLKKHLDHILLLLFFACVWKFFLWSEAFSDYAYFDEFYSLLKALGVEVYNNTLYVRMLSLFTNLFPDFLQLQKFNFLASNFALALAFYFYHAKRKVHISSNLLMTALLVLSPINLALTRKLHYWTITFFFLLMGIASEVEEKKRKILLCLGFLILAFFRYEFAFAFVFSIFFIIPSKYKYAHIFSLPILSLAAILIIYYCGPGMRQLAISSYGQGVFSWLLLLGQNVLYFSYNTFHSLDVLFVYFFPSLVAALILVVSTVKSWHQNLLNWITVIKKDFVFTFFPALVALFCIKYNDSYAIMGFVLLLSLMNFLFNSVRPTHYLVMIFVLVLAAFAIKLPDLKNNNLVFYSLRKNGVIHRNGFEDLKKEIQNKNVFTDDLLAVKVLFPSAKIVSHSSEAEVVIIHPVRSKQFNKINWAEYKNIDLLPGYLFIMKE